MAAALKEIAGRLGIGLVFKTSYDKANRTSLSAERGVGLAAALDGGRRGDRRQRQDRDLAVARAALQRLGALEAVHA
ncbi:hypothetical protein J8J40_32280, partial [Mycobacterium tuberculosis]|nr:hypothetical protein [Mycobacterium tuberculosis]